MSRTLFAQAAIAQIPKILTLMDRNRHSPTYGCCDRNFWHYKIIDFPSGMAQEFVLPLALAYHTDVADNPFYQQSALKDWVTAGIHYAARSAHRDGSCDDYFPFERAGGAAAFSLLACIDSYDLMQLEDETLLAFLAKRADWLAHHQESGQLTNHQALIVLCLELLAKRLNSTRWDRARSQRLEQVLAWQHEEGWFQEYEGCDPGYHTLTISCLARIYDLRPDPRLKQALIRAVELASYFIHPDGSYGGEYASRNTYNFFPHGFERVGRWWPDALRINDLFLQGLERGLGPCYADDHIVGHHTWNYLLAWRDFVPARPPRVPHPPGQIWLKQAGLLRDRRGNTELFIALNKGGVFKCFIAGELVASDTQFSVQVKQSKKVNTAVAHLVDSYPVQIEPDLIQLSGCLGWAKQTQMTPLKLMVLRFVMLSLGRFFPNLIRKILQTLLITGKKPAPLQFIRQLHWQDGQWQVRDQLMAENWRSVQQVAIGTDQTSIYVVMSRTFQAGQLLPWLDLTPQLATIAPGQPLQIERRLSPHPTGALPADESQH
jgi:hypothetical protein